MLIDENSVYSVCGVSPNPSNMLVKAQLYQVYPDPSDVKGRLVQKRYLTLPMDVPSDVGLVYLFRIVEYKDGRHPTTISEKYMLVNKEGKFLPTTFCRIDLTYRSLYVKGTEFDFMKAHEAADLFMKWEESMPRLLRFENLYWASRGVFDTFKWKVLTRELLNGKTEMERIINAWNHFSQYSNKSPELEMWLQSHPMVDGLNRPPITPVMITQVPYPPQTFQGFANGMRVGRSFYRRHNRNWGSQGPYLGYGWGSGSYVPQQQIPPQYGWPQQPFAGGSGPVCPQPLVSTYDQPQTVQNVFVEGFSQNPEQNPSKMF